MELGEENLREAIERKGKMPADTLLVVLFQILDALEHLHQQGFIHRDIKPANFVFDGNKLDILMIDFGLAKRIGEDVSSRPLDDFTKATEFVGPVFFSSPELIAYSSDKSILVDQQSDIFQVGKVAWYLATQTISAGIPSKRLCPFGGKFHSIISEMLADDKEDRPSSASEVRAMLKTL